MKQFLLIFPLLLAIGVNANAQITEAILPKQNSHNFIFHGGAAYYLNNKDVVTLDGNKDFLSVKNSVGYEVGLSYEYVHKTGFTITPSVAYGVHTRDIVWNFSFKDFDTNSSSIQNETSTFGYYSKMNFLKWSLSLGYNYEPAKLDHIFQFKAGLGLVQRFKGYNDRVLLMTAYEQQPGVGIIAPYALSVAYLGASEKWYKDNQPFYSLYLGTINNVSSNLIKDYRVGFLFTHSIGAKSSFDSAVADYYNASGDHTGTQGYANKFTSISLIAAITF